MKHIVLSLALFCALLAAGCRQESAETPQRPATDPLAYAGGNRVAHRLLGQLTENPSAAAALRAAFPDDRPLWDETVLCNSPLYGIHFLVPVLDAASGSVESALIYLLPGTPRPTPAEPGYGEWELLDAELLLGDIPFECRYLYSQPFVRWREKGYRVPAELTDFADRLNRGPVACDRNGRMTRSFDYPRDLRTAVISVNYTLTIPPSAIDPSAVGVFASAEQAMEARVTRICQDLQMRGPEYYIESCWATFTHEGHMEITITFLQPIQWYYYEDMRRNIFYDLEGYFQFYDCQFAYTYTETFYGAGGGSGGSIGGGDSGSGGGGSGGGGTGGGSGGGNIDANTGLFKAPVSTPLNPKIKTDNPKVLNLLLKINHDCLGSAAIAAVKDDLMISKDTASGLRVEVDPTDPTKYKYSISLKSDKDYALLEELIHYAQYQGLTIEEYKSRKLNYEIEAKVGWSMYLIRQGNDLNQYMNQLKDPFSFRSIGEFFHDYGQNSVVLSTFLKDAVDALRQINAYKDPAKYPYDENAMNLDTIEKLSSNC